MNAKRCTVWALGLGILLGFGISALGQAVGADVQVEKGGKWLPAKVVQKKPGQFLVHYAGMDSAFDEWVPPARVKIGSAPILVGQAVEAQKGARWLKAKVMQKKEGQFLVHYEGMDSAFDEWVADEKVRLPQAAATGTARNGFGTGRTARARPGEQDDPAEAELTQPTWTGARQLVFPPAARWTYKPAAPAAPAAPALQEAVSVILDGATGDFFEKALGPAVSESPRPLALVSLSTSFGQGKHTCLAQVVDIAAAKTLPAFEVGLETAPLAISPDGKLAVFGASNLGAGKKATLHLWSIDGDAPKLLMSFKPSEKASDWSRADVKFVEFIDATHILTGTADRQAVLWEIPAARAVYRMELDFFSTPPVLSPDRKVMLIDGAKQSGLFDTLTGRCLGIIEEKLPTFSAKAISPDGTKLAVVSGGNFQLWDLHQGKQVLEVGQSLTARNGQWVGDDLVLLDDRYLLDAKTGVVVWRLGKGNANLLITPAGRGYLTRSTRGDRGRQTHTLVALPLPLEKARDIVARLKPETAYLLTPGVKVSIDLSQVGIAEDLRQEAVQALTAQLKEHGVQVADGQPIKLVGTRLPGETKTITYQSFDRRTRSTVSYTQNNYSLKVMADDMVAWQTGSTSAAPPMVMMRPNETPQDVVNRMMSEADKFFSRAKLPKLIAQPRQPPGFGETPLVN